MGKKDSEIRTTIEKILENSSSGQRLKNYFSGLPDKRLRRAISILSSIYPDKTIISDGDFSFVMYMFSSIKIMEQESFSDFVRAVTLFDFTETQNKLLIDVIKTNIEILCDKCTFELDALLVSLFEPNELIQYLEVLTEKRNLSVLQRVLDILLYEDFSNSDVSDDQIEILKQKIQKSITG